MTRTPEQMEGGELLQAARAALDADSSDAPSLVFAVHELVPIIAAMVLLDVASGRTGAPESARARASALAVELVHRDTFHKLLAMIIRPVSWRGVPVRFLFDRPERPSPAGPSSRETSAETSWP